MDHRFSIVTGSQNANEDEFHGFGNFVIWLFEKCWKSNGNISKRVHTLAWNRQ